VPERSSECKNGESAFSALFDAKLDAKLDVIRYPEARYGRKNATSATRKIKQTNERQITMKEAKREMLARVANSRARFWRITGVGEN